MVVVRMNKSTQDSAWHIASAQKHCLWLLSISTGKDGVKNQWALIWSENALKWRKINYRQTFFSFLEASFFQWWHAPEVCSCHQNIIYVISSLSSSVSSKNQGWKYLCRQPQWLPMQVGCSRFYGSPSLASRFIDDYPPTLEKRIGRWLKQPLCRAGQSMEKAVSETQRLGEERIQERAPYKQGRRKRQRNKEVVRIFDR